MSALEPDRITFPDGWPLAPAELVSTRPTPPARPVAARQVAARTVSAGEVALNRRRRDWSWRPDVDWVTVLIYALVTALVVLAVWTAALLVRAVIALAVAVGTWLTSHCPLIVLAVLGLALLLALAGGGSRCAGLHCGGCRR